jgi:CBS domain-containing protein
MDAADRARYLVPATATLGTALAVIEENRHRSVIVVDDRDVAVGTLSDGDARKAILDRRLLSTPVRDVMNMNFISVGPDEHERAREIFAAEDHISLLPVVDDSGRILDVLKAY